MKKILFAALLLGSINSQAQLIGDRFNFNIGNGITEYYITNSPLSTPGNSRVMSWWKDSSWVRFWIDSFSVASLNASVNNGIPQSILWVNDSGWFKRSPITSLPISSGQIITGLGYTPANASSSGTVTSVGVSSSSGDIAISGSPITTSGTIAANLSTTGVSAGSYDNVTVDTKGRVTAGRNPTFNNAVTRPVNSTTYTISSTQPARVYYTVTIQCTASIGSNSSGSVALQYSINAGSTWVDLGSLANSNTVTLAVALNSVTSQTAVLSGEVPANALLRMNSSTSGTTGITYVRGNEVLY